MTNEIDKGSESLKQLVSRLRSIAERFLEPHPDPEIQRYICIGSFFAQETDEQYHVGYGDYGQLKFLELYFDASLDVKKAERAWTEGDEEFEPRVDTPEFAEQWGSFKRQKAEGQKILRLGNERYAKCFEPISEEELPAFVAKILEGAEEEIDENGEVKVLDARNGQLEG